MAKLSRQLEACLATLLALLPLCLAATSVADTHYVNVSNTVPVHPYTNWATAATVIQDAVDAAVDGDAVMVTNGVYVMTNGVFIGDGISVTSATGPLSTELRCASGGECRAFHVSYSNAVVGGFTIVGGAASEGGGVLCEWGGTVSNCVVRNCDAVGYGGGILCRNGGYVRRCVVVGNRSSNGGGIACLGGALIQGCYVAGNQAGLGGGISCEPGSSLVESRVRECFIKGNSAMYGGGLHLVNDDEVRNCMVIENTATAAGGGIFGGSHSGWSLMESCTVAGNVCWDGESGVSGAGLLVNSIVAGNVGYSELSADIDNCSFCCAAKLTSGQGNISTDPAFLAPWAGDYRLMSDSPCVDAGTNLSWMVNGLDQAGEERLLGRRVDIGAIERQPLLCGFVTDRKRDEFPNCVTNPFVFTSYVNPTVPESLHYRWDFDGDEMLDREGVGLTNVLHTYGSGCQQVLCAPLRRQGCQC